MSMLLLDAFRLAMDAHDGDGYGDQAFIYHPLDVAERVAHLGETYVAVALLHDALEANPHGFDEVVKASMPWFVFNPVKILTRIVGESYYDYARRIRDSRNQIAIAVKIADNEANLAAACKSTLVPRYKTSLEILRNERH